MRVSTLALFGLVLLVATELHAKEDLDPQALAKLAKVDPKKAASGFEKLLSAARRAQDLRRQKLIGTQAFALVPTKNGRPDPAAALLLLRSAGSPKAYSWFSAHVLADVALRQATATGEYEGLEPALKLASKRAAAKWGAYAGAMATYARGITLTLESKQGEATQAFGKVLQACAENGWARLAVHAGIEMVLAAAQAGETEAANKVLPEMLAALREDVDVSILFQAKYMAKMRLKEHHPRLHDLWEKALTTRINSYSGRKGPSAGGAGRSRKTTPLGLALKKWKKSKPLLVVTRTGDAFEIDYRFGKLEGKTHKLSPGITHIEQGGVVLAFWQAGVRLQQVCPQNQAVAGENAAPGLWQHFDPLAHGESWSLYSTGEVRIK